MSAGRRTHRLWIARGVAAALAILAGLAAVPSLMIAFVGLFAFDAPDATAHVLPYVMAMPCFSAPLLVATGGVLALSSVVVPDWRRTASGVACPAFPVGVLLWSGTLFRH
jgi:hypothetical protein